MNRKNFAFFSGVIVDICLPHGYWFDAGELPRVLEFITEGGLDRERKRQALQTEEEQRRLALLRAGLPLTPPPMSDEYDS